MSKTYGSTADTTEGTYIRVEEEAEALNTATQVLVEKTKQAIIATIINHPYEVYKQSSTALSSPSLEETFSETSLLVSNERKFSIAGYALRYTTLFLLFAARTLTCLYPLVLGPDLLKEVNYFFKPNSKNDTILFYSFMSFMAVLTAVDLIVTLRSTYGSIREAAFHDKSIAGPVYSFWQAVKNCKFGSCCLPDKVYLFGIIASAIASSLGKLFQAQASTNSLFMFSDYAVKTKLADQPWVPYLSWGVSLFAPALFILYQLCDKAKKAIVTHDILIRVGLYQDYEVLTDKHKLQKTAATIMAFVSAILASSATLYRTGKFQVNPLALTEEAIVGIAGIIISIGATYKPNGLLRSVADTALNKNAGACACTPSSVANFLNVVCSAVSLIISMIQLGLHFFKDAMNVVVYFCIAFPILANVFNAKNILAMFSLNSEKNQTKYRISVISQPTGNEKELCQKGELVVFLKDQGQWKRFDRNLLDGASITDSSGILDKFLDEINQLTLNFVIVPDDLVNEYALNELGTIERQEIASPREEGMFSSRQRVRSDKSIAPQDATLSISS